MRSFVASLAISLRLKDCYDGLEAHAVDLEGGIACAKQGVKAQEREF
jgi:hypothetical protein